jgi:hypothetical protein
MKILISDLIPAKDQIRNQVSDQVRNQIMDKVSDQVNDKVWFPIRNHYKLL